MASPASPIFPKPNRHKSNRLAGKTPPNPRALDTRGSARDPRVQSWPAMWFLIGFLPTLTLLGAPAVPTGSLVARRLCPWHPGHTEGGQMFPVPRVCRRREQTRLCCPLLLAADVARKAMQWKGGSVCLGEDGWGQERALKTDTFPPFGTAVIKRATARASHSPRQMDKPSAETFYFFTRAALSSWRNLWACYVEKERLLSSLEHDESGRSRSFCFRSVFWQPPACQEPRRRY